MNLSDRKEAIIRCFARYYYGHLEPISFDGLQGGWSDWASLIRRFAESIVNPRKEVEFDVRYEIEKLQNDIVHYATTIHQSRFFPVVPCFKEKLFSKLKELFAEVGWVISSKLCDFLLTANVNAVLDKEAEVETHTQHKEKNDIGDGQSEYVFKTYEILSGKKYCSSFI